MSLPVLYASIDGPAAAASRVDPLSAASRPPTARLIVKYRDAALRNVAALNGALGQPQLDHLSSLAGQPVASERAMSGGAFVVRLLQSLPAEQVESLARYLATDPSIEYAAPDRLKQPKRIPNDPDYPQQWHYQSPPGEPAGADLPPAWDVTTGAAAIVVAVIDTGSMPLHPDLAGRYVGGYDMISDPHIANDGDGRDADASDPGDWVTNAESLSGFFAGCQAANSSWHGTHVAGTIGAASNNGIGVAGVNWVSRILPVRALGKCGGFDSDIIDAIVWAAGGVVPDVPINPNPARVLNLSIGGAGTCGAYQGAIDTALSAGAVVTIAAGNDNQDASLSSPGNCNGVITVAAIGRQGQRAAYSNFGALVEIAAPGGDFSDSGVLSTLNSGVTFRRSYIYADYYGTSMATAHVAGIASLILSANPSLTPAQVLAVIQNTARAFPTQTARDCTTALCGAGIIDAGAAVAAIALPPTTTSLGSGANPANAGGSVGLTATVSGVAPSGSVAFSEAGSA
ncbi:MAG: S8 family peptidase, partial [Casimicrobiaceae bacterium]